MIQFILLNSCGRPTNLASYQGFPRQLHNSIPANWLALCQWAENHQGNHRPLNPSNSVNLFNDKIPLKRKMLKWQKFTTALQVPKGLGVSDAPQNNSYPSRALPADWTCQITCTFLAIDCRAVRSAQSFRPIVKFLLRFPFRLPSVHCHV